MLLNLISSISNSDFMKKFAIRSLLYTSPLILVVLAIIVIDPYYLLHKDKEYNQEIFDIGSSFDQGRRYKIFTYFNNPTDKIILGASEICRIDERNIPESGWHSLAFGGAPLQESLRLFFEITSINSVKKAIIAPEFIKYYNAVSSVNGDPYYANFQWETSQSFKTFSIYNNKLDYFVDKYTLKATYEVINHKLGANSLQSVPQLSKEAFWEHQLNYAKGVYGENALFDFKQEEIKQIFADVKNHADSLGVDVVIVIPPQHNELLQLELGDKIFDTYQSYICTLVDIFGQIQYLAYADGISDDDESFSDPFHCLTAEPLLDVLFRGEKRYLLSNEKQVINRLNEIKNKIQ